MTSLRRRQLLQDCLTLAGVGLLAGCGNPFAPAAPPARHYRIGYLSQAPDTVALQAFRDGLHDLGYIEGQTIEIEERWAVSTEQLPSLAVELVSLPVDLIVAAGGSPSAQAAKGATRTIPIVFMSAGDPVRQGLVTSLARPGGNVTGLNNQQAQVQGKHLQLLRELVPGVSRALYLTDTALTELSGGLREAQQSAQALGIQLLTPTIGSTEDLTAALTMAGLEQAGALLVTGTPLMTRERDRIVAFATTAWLPLLAQDRSFVAAGGLSYYGPNQVATYRHAASYVDKILKGARPSDLPVEQPAVFDFVINLKAAQALELTIAPSVLAQATEIIQ